ncbi:MAG: ATP-binding protein [Imperialibacter sp.]
MDLKTNREKVFGLYKRFHESIEGKGVGLFMTKTQVESLGGRIHLQSELGGGSEFTVELPHPS